MTLRRPTTMAHAAVLAAVVALSACTGSSDDPAPAGSSSQSSTSSSTPPTTSSAAPSTSTTPTTSTPATSPAGPTFPKGVPPAAQQRTPEGAKAFAEHFVGVLNRSWTTPDATLLEPLCAPRYEACGAYLSTAKELASKGQRYDGNPLSVSFIKALAEKSARQPVLLVGYQEKRNVVTKDGKIVLTDPREPLRIVCTMDWTDRGWQVYSAKLAV